MGKIKLGKYKHYKGSFYKVLAIVRHSETLEELVLYECLYDNPKSKLWVRPRKMFEETVKINGAQIPRFEFVIESND